MRTGSAVQDARSCTVCGIARGVIYDGPIHGGQANALCLDGIWSGDAARILGTAHRPVSFTDVGWGVLASSGHELAIPRGPLASTGAYGSALTMRGRISLI
jgi:uncharacterized protein CbrC (UPF0167 family)